MRLFFSIFIIMACCQLHAQQSDTAQLICTYTTTAGNTTEQCKLLIGQQHYQYFSETKRTGEALLREARRKGVDAEDRVTNAGKYAILNPFFEIAGNVQSGSYTVQEELVGQRYRYADSFPVQKWVLTTDTTTISAVLCQKATIHFRGRNYTVWFAPDIASPCGPWKFYGLPGLIVYAEDEKKQFTFRLINIDYSNKLPFSAMPPKSAIATSFKTFMKLKKQYNEDPIGMLENMTGAKVTFSNPDEIAAKVRAEQKAYNPIELTAED